LRLSRLPDAVPAKGARARCCVADSPNCRRRLVAVFFVEPQIWFRCQPHGGVRQKARSRQDACCAGLPSCAPSGCTQFHVVSSGDDIVLDTPETLSEVWAAVSRHRPCRDIRKLLSVSWLPRFDGYQTMHATRAAMSPAFCGDLSQNPGVRPICGGPFEDVPEGEHLATVTVCPSSGGAESWRGRRQRRPQRSERVVCRWQGERRSDVGRL
jgi:hypothetical protein